MNAQEKWTFKDYKVDETHLHTVFQMPLSETENLLRSYYDYFNYGSLTALSLHDTDHGGFDPICNIKNLYFKDIFSTEGRRFYVYGNVNMYGDLSPEEYLNQAKTLYRMGVDGYKTLEGKPGYRKNLGRSLADPVYDKMYAFIEEMGMPLKIHICDPRKYWGPKETIAPTAIARGWWYGDGSYPAFESIWGELYEVLDKFPRLKLCVAHFGYISFDIERCISLLEKYPNTAFDLTPGAAMFLDFTKEPDIWREFFAKYSDRIFFGTDLYNHLDGNGNMTVEQRYEMSFVRYTQVRSMLEKDSSNIVSIKFIGDCSPLNLPDSVLINIYSKNTAALLGEGRALDRDLILSEARRLRGELVGGKYDFLNKEKIALFIESADIIIARFGG